MAVSSDSMLREKPVPEHEKSCMDFYQPGGTPTVL
jgi:hypothetical protein